MRSMANRGSIAEGRAILHRTRERWRRLTPAEVTVVRFLARGLVPREIAARRESSINTVRTQLKSAMAKIGVHSQIALISRFYDLGVRELDRKARNRLGTGLRQRSFR